MGEVTILLKKGDWEGTAEWSYTREMTLQCLTTSLQLICSAGTGKQQFRGYGISIQARGMKSEITRSLDVGSMLCGGPTVFCTKQ